MTRNTLQYLARRLYLPVIHYLCHSRIINNYLLIEEKSGEMLINIELNIVYLWTVLVSQLYLMMNVEIWQKILKKV